MMKLARKSVPLKHPNTLKTLLRMVINSVGSTMFQSSFYVNIDDEEVDILKQGELSCAFFVSSLLVIFRLCKEVHARVGGPQEGGLEGDVRSFGWEQIPPESLLKPGDLIFWGPAPGYDHRHVGFYVGDGQAVSNSTRQRTPQRHQWNYANVEAVYRHPSLQ